MTEPLVREEEQALPSHLPQAWHLNRRVSSPVSLSVKVISSTASSVPQSPQTGGLTMSLRFFKLGAGNFGSLKGLAAAASCWARAISR